MPSEPKDRLRLLIVLRAGSAPAWQLTLVGELESSDLCDVIVASAPLDAESSDRRSWLFRAYEAWESRRFQDRPEVLAPIRHHRPQPREGEWEVDAALWLADSPPPDRALRLPHGAWYIRQGAARVDADAPLLDELRKGDGVVETALCQLTPEGERVLLASVGPTDPVSLHRARTRAYAKAARLPARYLRRLRMGHVAEGVASAPPESPRAPGTLRTLEYLATLVVRLTIRRARALALENQWFVAYRRLEAPDRRLEPLADFTTLVPPRGHFYADPFPIRHSAGDVIIFEDYRRSEDRGVLAYADVVGGGERLSPPVPALDLDTHLSYPFVFQHDGETYMVPETRRLNRVQLMRAVGGFAKWEPVRTLIDAMALTDSTLLFHGGRVWLFGALAADDGAALDELHVFSAPSLHDEWTPHPLNPIVSDVRSARPAGAFLEHRGQLIRPAQDCSRIYGWRIVLNRVDVLTPNDYRETAIGHIEPVDRGITRTHTYNASAGYETVDGLRTVFKLATLRRPPTSVRFRVRLYDRGDDGRHR
jgi:hypothetical protein